MAVYGSMVITSQGLNLYAKIQSGAPVVFTRMQIGSGQLGAQNPVSLVSLISPVAYIPINSISSSGNTAHVKGIFENTNISAATYSCELGLFATDPDLGEILYAYANAGDQGDTIPPISAGPFSKQYQINAAIGNASSVSATIPTGTYIPTTDKGIANGVAQLDANAQIPSANLPTATAATANKIIIRDGNGQASVGAPIVPTHIARKQDVDAIRSDNSKALIAEVRTTDPVSPALGQIWFRSDL